MKIMLVEENLLLFNVIITVGLTDQWRPWWFCVGSPAPNVILKAIGCGYYCEKIWRDIYYVSFCTVSISFWLHSKVDLTAVEQVQKERGIIKKVVAVFSKLSCILLLSWTLLTKSGITQKRDTRGIVFLALIARKEHQWHSEYKRYIGFRSGICLICQNAKHNKEGETMSRFGLKADSFFLPFHQIFAYSIEHISS